MAAKTEVRVGQVWTAKVSGNTRRVEVIGIEEGKFRLRNTETGRTLATLRTARFLRVLAAAGPNAAPAKPASMVATVASGLAALAAAPVLDYNEPVVPAAAALRALADRVAAAPTLPAECAVVEIEGECAACDEEAPTTPSLLDMVAMAPGKLAAVAEAMDKAQAATPAAAPTSAPARPASGRQPKVTCDGETSIWLDLSAHTLGETLGTDPLEFKLLPSGKVTRGASEWRSPSQALGQFTGEKLPGSGSWRTFYVVDEATGEQLAIDSLRPAGKCKGYAYSQPGVRAKRATSSAPRTRSGGRTLAERVAAKRLQVESTLATLATQKDALAKLIEALDKEALIDTLAPSEPAVPAAPDFQRNVTRATCLNTPASLPAAPPAPASEARSALAKVTLNVPAKVNGAVEKITLLPAAAPAKEEQWQADLTGEHSLDALKAMPLAQLREIAKGLAGGAKLPRKKLALAEFAYEKQVAARW